MPSSRSDASGRRYDGATVTELSGPATDDAVEALVHRFSEWAADRPDIHAMLIVGSRARTERPADRWSDLDLVFTTTDPRTYLDESGWLGTFGQVLLTFVEPTPIPGVSERRVLFEDGLDVDLVPVLIDGLPALLSPAGDVITRGVRVLVDKDGELGRRLVEGPTEHEHAHPELTAHEFESLVADVLYHFLWTARKLRRGELWTARGCLEGYLRWHLLRLVEWHARLVRGTTDVWFEGRFLDQWADRDVLEGIAAASSRYDAADVRRALYAMADLFRQLATETGRARDFAYPDDRHERVMALVERVLDEP